MAFVRRRNLREENEIQKKNNVREGERGRKRENKWKKLFLFKPSLIFTFLYFPFDIFFIPKRRKKKQKKNEKKPLGKIVFCFAFPVIVFFLSFGFFSLLWILRKILNNKFFEIKLKSKNV